MSVLPFVKRYPIGLEVTVGDDGSADQVYGVVVGYDCEDSEAPNCWPCVFLPDGASGLIGRGGWWVNRPGAYVQNASAAPVVAIVLDRLHPIADSNKDLISRCTCDMSTLLTSGCTCGGK